MFEGTWVRFGSTFRFNPVTNRDSCALCACDTRRLPLARAMRCDSDAIWWRRGTFDGSRRSFCPLPHVCVTHELVKTCRAAAASRRGRDLSGSRRATHSATASRPSASLVWISHCSIPQAATAASRGRVPVHQMLAIPRHLFDWIYIDGDHSYEGGQRARAAAARSSPVAIWCQRLAHADP